MFSINEKCLIRNLDVLSLIRLFTSEYVLKVTHTQSFGAKIYTSYRRANHWRKKNKSTNTNKQCFGAKLRTARPTMVAQRRRSIVASRIHFAAGSIFWSNLCHRLSVREILHTYEGTYEVVQGKLREINTSRHSRGEHCQQNKPLTSSFLPPSNESPFPRGLSLPIYNLLVACYAPPTYYTYNAHYATAS